MSQLVVAVELSRDNLQKIAVGMEATVDINAHGSHRGKVMRLPVTQNNQNNNYYDPWNPYPRNNTDSVDNYVLIELDPFPPEVARETPLSAAIVVERKENAVVIPPSALRTYGGRTYVQIVEEDGTKREVDVEVGLQTSTQVEIIKGLEPGMKVVGR
jgi:macrolide-specific efflux system membrane fusion protein